LTDVRCVSQYLPVLLRHLHSLAPLHFCTLSLIEMGRPAVYRANNARRIRGRRRMGRQYRSQLDKKMGEK